MENILGAILQGSGSSPDVTINYLHHVSVELSAQPLHIDLLLLLRVAHLDVTRGSGAVDVKTLCAGQGWKEDVSEVAQPGVTLRPSSP